MPRNAEAARIHRERQQLIADAIARGEEAPVFTKRPRDRRKYLTPGWPSASVQYVDAASGMAVVRLTSEEDFVKLGTLQNHCSGAHGHWTIDREIWHFLTVVDSSGEAHGTVHLKDVEWENKAHPDDALPHKNIHMGIGGYRASEPNQYSNSTSYGSRTSGLKTMRDTVLVDGHKCGVVLARGYGGCKEYNYGNGKYETTNLNEYGTVLMAWYNLATEAARETPTEVVFTNNNLAD